jgi:hypothetical protein
MGWAIHGAGRREGKIMTDGFIARGGLEMGRRILPALALMTIFQSVASAKEALPAAPPPRPPYARIADLVGAVPAIAVIRVTGLTVVPPERSPGLVAGKRRLLVDGETVSLIRGNDVLARQMSFLMDVPESSDRKPPKWRDRTLLIFGEVQQRVDFFQLISSTAAIPWSNENEAFVRQIATDLAAPDAPPAITGVSSVFHVDGAVEGEGETQIFLDTASEAPISLSIVRRPDEEPQFGVSLGELVDNSAALPPSDSPLWYRLTCGLPARLPAEALRGQTASDAAAASKDYAAFLKALAPCDRTATLIS